MRGGVVDCPGCGGGLTEQRAGGMLVDRCVACDGVWFDAGELASAVSDADAVERELMARAARGGLSLERSCPRCATPLSVAELGRVAVYPCLACHGLWLDATAVLAVHELSLRSESPVAGSESSLGDITAVDVVSGAAEVVVESMFAVIGGVVEGVLGAGLDG